VNWAAILECPEQNPGLVNGEGHVLHLREAVKRITPGTTRTRIAIVTISNSTSTRRIART
jgi:hypothetical protein